MSDDMDGAGAGSVPVNGAREHASAVTKARSGRARRDFDRDLEASVAVAAPDRVHDVDEVVVARELREAEHARDQIDEVATHRGRTERELTAKMPKSPIIWGRKEPSGGPEIQGKNRLARESRQIVAR